MKLLVTGSSGLVGQHLVGQLMAQGHQIRLFDIVSQDGATGQDIRDAKALRDAVQDCDGVFHLAAVSRVAWGEDDPDTCMEINVAATQSLVDILLEQAERPWLVFASSREVYGDPASTFVSETDAVAPFNTYGRSKATGEAIVHAAAEAGLRTAIVRLSNVYGALNDHPDRAVPSLVWRAINGEDIKLTGGDNYFDFVHVRDAADGIISAATLLAEGEHHVPTVHLATGIATSLRALAQMAVEVCQSQSRITIVPARDFDVSGYCGNPSFAGQILGWRAKTALREGMAELRDALVARGSPMPEVKIPAPYSANS